MRRPLTWSYWFSEPVDDPFVQLFRYFWVGGVAFIVDFSVLFAMTHFAKVHYLISAAVAFVLGLATNYTLSVSWVFKQRKLQNAVLEFLIFGLVGIAGLGLNELIMWTCTDKAGFHYLVSKIISTGMVFFFNFIFRKLLLFRRS